MAQPHTIKSRASTKSISVAEAKRLGWIPKTSHVKRDTGKSSESKKKVNRNVCLVASSDVCVWMDDNALILESSVVPITMNAIVNMHGIQWNQYKNAWHSRIMVAVIEAGLSDVRIDQAWVTSELDYNGKARDNDGTCIKQMIDGLVNAGLYHDDSPLHFPASPFLIQTKADCVKFKMTLFFSHQDYVSFIQSCCAKTARELLA